MLLTTTPSALRAAGVRACLSSNSGAALQQRWLSASPALRAGHIVTFRESSSPELDALLDNFRQKAILPTYLSPEQRKKMYKAKLKNILEHDPITMEIDGVVHKFRHVNKTTDLPSTNKTLKKALELMKTPADFQNVPAFLEGCLRARRDIPRELRNKIIRQAAMHNSQHVIIECAKAVDRTGFKLNSSENINELLVSLQLPAIESGWAEGKTKVALKQVRLIINMLEDERHFPGRQTKCQFPFYRDPQVLASGLHMAAVRAVHHLDGKDADGKVTRFAEELVALWPEDAGLLDLQPAEFYQNADKTKYLLDRNHFLWYASPVLNGLNLAAQVVSGSNAGLAQQLQKRAELVAQEVKFALESDLRKKGGRGEYLYNKLLNPEQEQPAESQEAS